jgi:serine/threonine protein kinase
VSADRWERLTDLYHVAVALTAEERSSFLSEECADDPTLQAEVERMVAAHDRAGRVDEPASAPSLAADAWATAEADPLLNDGEGRDATPSDGSFGRYRVVRELARGGFGTSYVAERDDDRYGPHMVVWLLDKAADPLRALERFRTDRHTLGSREHPNVGRLLDDGRTHAGQVYVVTEHVDGEPIDTYADSRRLSITERLQLFLQVCNALAFAHRRHVVHGHLGASSIIVSPSGVPKIVGFGILEHHSAQADDVKALGAVLGQMLSNEPNGTRRKLRADLDTILSTALGIGLDGGRYESVETLADDIRKYLERPSTRSRPDKGAATHSMKSRRPSALLAWTLAVSALGLLATRMVALRESAVAPPVAAPIPERVGSRDRVLVMDLADRLGDAPLAAALSDAFRVALTESPSLKVLSTRQLRATLGGADDDSLARVVILRRAVRSVVSGRIEAANGGFALTAQVTSTEKGSQPVTIQETAADSLGVMTALGRVAERLREQLGESPSTIAASPRVDEVVTASVAALMQYSSAVKALSAGDRTSGLRLLKSAVALDTGFASAYRLMASTYADAGDRARAAEALDHAVANRARLPFQDRNYTIASHAMNVLGDYATAIDAYNRILQRTPGDVRALTNLGLVYAARREYAVQESLLVRAIAADPGATALVTRLALAQVNQGKYDEAQRVLDKLAERAPGLRGAQRAAVALAASKRDWQTAEREARASLGPSVDDSADATDGVEALAGIVMAQGRLAEAEQQLRRIITLGTRDESPRAALTAALRIGYLELRYRHAPAAALAVVNSAVSRFPLERMAEGDRPYDELARFYVDAGRAARARELVAQAARTKLGRQRGTDANRRWTLGAIAIAEGRAWEGEIEIHRAAETQACPICALPDLARAYEVAGKPDSAIATYERYVSSPWQSRFETDEIELGFAMKRLGELYQQQNDRTRAAAQYTALLQLWRGADSELDPLIADVRRRLDQTSAVSAKARD